MSQNTPIEWTDVTWNPTKGCSRISPGCKKCYAEKIAGRFSGEGNTFHGFAIMKNHEAHWTGKVELIESKLSEPLHWRKPRRVFVNSMSDLFHEALPDEAIDRVFAVMEVCRKHTFQVLTKRAERMRQYMTDRWRRAGGLLSEQGKRPLDNVHLGVSIEDPFTAVARIPLLLQTPAAVRFVSYEPALAGVNLKPWLYRSVGTYMPDGSIGTRPKLDWVIIGGESGPGARPFDIEWARTTIRDCKVAGVPVFVKQLGSRPGYQRKDGWRDIDLKDSKGGDMDEWPEWAKVREFPALSGSR